MTDTMTSEKTGLAKGEGLSRRGMIAGLAVVAVPPVLTSSAFSATETPDQAVDRLWRRYTDLVVEGKDLHRALNEAEAALPEWARVGPQYLRGDGTFCGDEVGWPRDESIQPPNGRNIMLCVRSGTREIEDRFAFDVRTWPKKRDLARSYYRDRMRKLVARLRAQRAEEERVGLPAIIAADDINYEKRGDIEDAIELTPPCPNATAALLLIECKNLSRNCTIGNLPGLNVLQHWRPNLSGLIGEHVNLLLDSDAFAPLNDLPFSI